MADRRRTAVRSSSPLGLGGTGRTEGLLSLEWFRNRMEATIGIERWRRHYNEERPHMSLGDLTPAEFKAQLETTHRGDLPAVFRTN